MCAALWAMQFSVARAQPASTPQPLWLVPWTAPMQLPAPPFPTPFWLWPVPWSMPLAPVWLPHGLPTPQPVPPGDSARAPEPAAQSVVVTPPPAADAATGGGTPETRASVAEPPAVDVRPAEVGPGHAADTDAVAPIDRTHQQPPKAEAVVAAPSDIPIPPVAAAPATDTLTTTGAPAAEATPPSTPTRKAKPAPRLKPLPPPKTLGSTARTDTARPDGKARKLCWRDGKLDVCP